MAEWTQDDVDRIVEELLRDTELAQRHVSAIDEAAERADVPTPLEAPVYWAVQARLMSYGLLPGLAIYFRGTAPPEQEA
jgi:hypothetical protein